MHAPYLTRMKTALTFLCLVLAVAGLSQTSEKLAHAWDAYNKDRFEQCLASLEEIRGAEAMFLQANCYQ